MCPDEFADILTSAFELFENISFPSMVICPKFTAAFITICPVPEVPSIRSSLDLGQVTIAGNEIFSNVSNADLKLSANSSGQIAFDDFTKLTAQGSDPTAVAGTTHLYAKTESGGGTGLFYVNTSSSGELVSKAKAQIFGLIF